MNSFVVSTGGHRTEGSTAFYSTAAGAVEFEGRAGFEPAFPQRACYPGLGDLPQNRGASLALPVSYPLNDRPVSSLAFRGLRW